MNKMNGNINGGQVSDTQELRLRISDLHTNILSPQEMTEIYDKWAATYDEANLNGDGAYTGWAEIAKEIGNIFLTNRDAVKIIDIAAGTGLVGEQLHNLGFREMDALDASQGMLDACKKKNVYKNFFHEYITDTELPIAAGSYDCLVVAGAFSDSHIPTVAIKEMARLVKPGGYVCNVMREEFVHIAKDYKNGRLEGLMDQLEKDGVWKKVFKKVMPNYVLNKEGI